MPARMCSFLPPHLLPLGRHGALRPGDPHALHPGRQLRHILPALQQRTILCHKGIPHPLMSPADVYGQETQSQFPVQNVLIGLAQRTRSRPREH
jgi:hypothetical protein